MKIVSIDVIKLCRRLTFSARLRFCAASTLTRGSTGTGGGVSIRIFSVASYSFEAVREDDHRYGSTGDGK